MRHELFLFCTSSLCSTFALLLAFTRVDQSYFTESIPQLQALDFVLKLEEHGRDPQNAHTFMAGQKGSYRDWVPVIPLTVTRF